MAKYPQIGIRVNEELLEQIDAWRRKQDSVPTRPEAVRRLIELGLRVINE
jgi:metal-responsive CopG/Arc/MetJ family transcriptional regulator